MNERARSGWIGGSMLMVATLTTIASCGLVGRGERAEPDVGALTETVERCLAEPPAEGAELVIWLAVDAQPADIEQVDATLAANPGVTEYSYVDRDQTYAEFEEYWADDPAVIDLVEADQLPTSFVVTVGQAGAIDELERQLEPFGSVGEVELLPNPACDEPRAELRAACDRADPRTIQVWLSADAGDAEVDGVATRLDGSPLVTDVAYLDADASFAELTGEYREQEEVAGLVEPGDVPTSFVVTLAEPGVGGTEEAVQALVDELRLSAGVVDVDRHLTDEQWRELTGCLDVWSLSV